MTERKQAEEALAQKAASEALSRRAQEILDISTPVVQVWEGIILAPIIGTLDSQRTQQLTEKILDGIVETRSTVALIDITGVPAVDTQTARHLIESISAVRLLGADVILTGIRPAIAQTLVHLGIDLGGVTTRSSLAAGLRAAMENLGLRVNHRD
jgi:rsbT co-antagonist protein RsbR